MVQEYQVGQTIGRGGTEAVYTIKLTDDRKTTPGKLKGEMAKYRVKADLKSLFGLAQQK